MRARLRRLVRDLCFAAGLGLLVIGEMLDDGD